MINVTGVQFQKHGKIYYYDANQLDVHVGDYVVADTPKGHDLAIVAVDIQEIDETTSPAPMKKLVRIATQQDIQHSTENRQKEREAYTICQKKIEEHQLDMKLVSVEYAFDNSKILFYFTANGRVDFRSLVKDLASVFKMRIELRQIGVRDEAKMLGGLGPCGRPICCGTFLSEFQPVSIKMAKEQNLSLNPTKISGVCGRLMCCLKYEQDHYEQTRKRMPRVGKEVNTPDGIGTVSDLNIVKETVIVRITNGDSSELKEYPLENVSRIQQSRDAVAGNKPGSREESERTQELREDIPDEILTENEAIPADEKESEETERNKAPEKPNRNRQDRKPREPRQVRNNQLGKPVRRENPNKPKAENPDGGIKESKADVKEAPKTSMKEEPKPVSRPAAEEKSVSGHNNSWAEALQKAMDAIN